MNILAVGAHPDDVELGCFGTLLEKKKAGHNVYAVALAPGAYGSFRWEEIEAVWTKARNALRAGGGKGDYLLGKFPIGSLSQDWATVGFVDDLIKTYSIDHLRVGAYASLASFSRSYGDTATADMAEKLMAEAQSGAERILPHIAEAAAETFKVSMRKAA